MQQLCITQELQRSVRRLEAENTKLQKTLAGSPAAAQAQRDQMLWRLAAAAAMGVPAVLVGLATESLSVSCHTSTVYLAVCVFLGMQFLFSCISKPFTPFSKTRASTTPSSGTPVLPELGAKETYCDQGLQMAIKAAEPSSEWVNAVMKTFWTKIGEFVEEKLRRSVLPMLQSALPSYLVGVDFGEINMGLTPVQFENVITKRTSEQTPTGEKEHLKIMLDLIYNGDAKIVLRIAGVNIGISDIQICGRLVIEMLDLIPYPPFFSGISIYFLNPPQLRTEWCGAADVASWKGIRKTVNDVLHKKFAEQLVIPNRIASVIKPSMDFDIFRLKYPTPDGLLKLTVLEACNLKPADTTWHSMGKCVTSDPFVEIKLGAEVFTTVTVKQTLQPVWENQAKEFLVYDAEEQDILVSVFDEDLVKEHDLLGRTSVSVASLRSSRDLWIDLADDGEELEEDVKQATCRQLGSRLRLRCEWRPFLSTLTQTAFRHRVFQPGGLVQPADLACALFVGVYKAEGLPCIAPGHAHWCEVRVAQDVRSTRRSCVPTDQEVLDRLPESVLQKITDMSKANLLPSLIADLLGVPLSAVHCHIEAKAHKSEPKESGQLSRLLKSNSWTFSKGALPHGADDAPDSGGVSDDAVGGTRDVVWEQGFTFLLSGNLAHTKVVFSVRTDSCSRGSNMGQPVGCEPSYALGRLRSQPGSTEVAELPLHLAGFPGARVRARVQLRSLGCIEQQV